LEVLYVEEQAQTRPKCVLCLGTFDGVHLGHQAIVAKARSVAMKMGVQVALLTFDRHPRSLLKPDQSYESVLTPLPEKRNLLEQAGVDLIYVQTFDRSFSRLTCEEFVVGFLVRLEPVHVVVGYNYSFGAGGVGTAALLAQLCGQRGISVSIVEPFTVDEQQVSSSLIRDQLHRGAVDEAQRVLGHVFALEGVIVRGDGRGAGLGFPTANLNISLPYVMPRTGVYLVRATVNNYRGPGVTNVGFRPTFEDEAPRLTVETHLLNYDERVYGETLRLEFFRYIREEHRFQSVDELVRQINLDVSKARSLYIEMSEY